MIEFKFIKYRHGSSVVVAANFRREHSMGCREISVIKTCSINDKKRYLLLHFNNNAREYYPIIYYYYELDEAFQKTKATVMKALRIIKLKNINSVEAKRFQQKIQGILRNME